MIIKRYKKSSLVIAGVATLGVLSAVSFLAGCANDMTDISSSTIDTVEELPTEVNNEMKTLISAVENLKNFNGAYIVASSVQMPAETSNYIEVNDANGSYTQYSVDEDGGIGQTSYETASNTEFMLFDYLTNDGKGYLVNQSYVEGENTQWLELPTDYVTKLQSRKVMYADKWLSGTSDVEKDEVISVDLGSGAIDLQLYTASVSSDVIADILGIDTLGLYTSLRETSIETSDKNMQSLMDTYIDELSMNLTFSDAKATYGVYEGVLRYIKLEIGGLGSRMTYIKTVYDIDEAVTYDTPDFNSQETYYASVKELADYIAKYDSYDEAMQDLYSDSNGVLPKETTEETPTEEVTEVSAEKGN